jgi:hypothetical protein
VIVTDFNDWDAAPSKKKASSGSRKALYDKAAVSDGWDDGGQPSLVESTNPGLHWLLTLLSLVFAGGTAFLMAWLTRDMNNRSVPLVGLMFVAPVAVLTLTALYLEHMSSLMTPQFSRRAQMVLALAASAAVFLVGCLAQLSYVIVDVQPADYIFLVDKSSSMGMGTASGNDITNQRKQALIRLLDGLKDGTVMGLVLFNDVVMPEDCIAPVPLDDGLRARFTSKLDQNDFGGTNFDQPLQIALDMIKNSKDMAGRPVRIVIMTDGEPTESIIIATGSLGTLLDDLKRYNASVSCVRLSGEIQSNLLNYVIDGTGGDRFTADTADQLVQGLEAVSKAAGMDVLRDPGPEAKWICGVLFMLTGLVIGTVLSLMLSRQRQFRYQLILSPLAGAAAFMICKYMPGTTGWIREGFAFSAFSLVFMKKNR